MTKQDKTSVKHGLEQGHNDLSSLQNQFDDFINQENAAHKANSLNEGSASLQHNLDEFVDTLQDQVNSFVLENERNSSTNKLASHVTKSHNFSQHQQESKSTNPTNQVQHQPRPVSYSKVIFRVLLAAGILSAALFWYIEPAMEPDSLSRFFEPQKLAEQATTPTQAARQTMPNPIIIEKSTAKLNHDNKLAVTAKRLVSANNQNIQSNNAQQTHQLNISAAEATAGLSTDFIKPKPQQTIVSTEKIRVAVRVANIRSAPNRSAEVLFRLIKGATVTKINQQGDWYQVRLKNGIIAWAHHSVF